MTTAGLVKCGYVGGVATSRVGEALFPVNNRSVVYDLNYPTRCLCPADDLASVRIFSPPPFHKDGERIKCGPSVFGQPAACFDKDHLRYLAAKLTTLSTACAAAVAALIASATWLRSVNAAVAIFSASFSESMAAL